jgi:hypothetical protein
MTTTYDPPSGASSPLETFVRDYVEGIGGVWDEVEPQVYDLLIPVGEGPSATAGLDREIVRIAFDPEAISEHPGSQLASFGTPLIDRLLGDAVRRGRRGQLYLIGLNLAPHDLTGRARRSITLPPTWSLRVARVRPLHFAQAVFWLQATFVSDRKEREILPIAIDLHSHREVRHLEQLLDHTRLADNPSIYFPEARRSSVAAAYALARERVLRTLAALSNTRAREVSDHIERQLARMQRYYADLRGEQEQQARRAASRQEDLAKQASRRVALEREERLRVAELRQKGALRVELRLLTLLLIHQPKLLLHGVAVSPQEKAATLELVWDPLTETVEAVPCPSCARPTFALEPDRQLRLVCPACSGLPVDKRKSGHR